MQKPKFTGICRVEFIVPRTADLIILKYSISWTLSHSQMVVQEWGHLCNSCWDDSSPSTATHFFGQVQLPNHRFPTNLLIENLPRRCFCRYVVFPIVLLQTDLVLYGYSSNIPSIPNLSQLLLVWCGHYGSKCRAPQSLKISRIDRRGFLLGSILQ